MQTFLPYPDFEKSAKVLDYRRLGKQRVEAFQILNALIALKKDPTAKIGWRHHPAVLMWKGCEYSLCLYGIAMCTEWKARGYIDLMKEAFISQSLTCTDSVLNVPSWLGSKKFHTSHRSNLLRKKWRHYRKYWPKLSSKLPYYWPVKNNNNYETTKDTSN